MTAPTSPLPAILREHDRLVEAWQGVHAELGPRQGDLDTGFLGLIGAVWGRDFDVNEMVRVSNELKSASVLGYPCMCGNWGCHPLWASKLLDGERGLVLYPIAAGWTAVPCFSCKLDHFPSVGEDGLPAGETCTICLGDGVTPNWVTNMVACPARSVDQVRHAGLWFPASCSACGGWGRRKPIERTPSDDDRGSALGAKPDLPPTPRFRREGERFHVAYAGGEVVLEDRVGVRYLELLVARPYDPIECLTLSAAVRGEPTSPANEADLKRLGLRFGSGGAPTEMTDAKALQQYRVRLKEIESELQIAKKNNDVGRCEQLEKDRNLLEAEIARAIGPRGRPRSTVVDAERARKAVRKAIADAIEYIKGVHADLGAHLHESINLGSCCVYRPRPVALK